ncbi:MAG: LysR family transcriptional regulator [Burkholderiaceae bacterium]|nr:LysR family transcriptional regulator [Burkholderiaceae bacterium]
MRLRHIEVFHAIMQVGSISGAAQVLHISQPAVTKVLQHCEMQLGLKLFERVKGKLYPTPEAQKLFTEVDRVNRDLQSVRRLANSLRDGAAETVKLVATPTVATTLVPGAMTAWRKKYADMRCQLATQHTREIVSALLVGEADFALSLQDPRHPGIQCESVAQGPMTVIAPPGTWPAALADSPLPIAELPTRLIALPEDDPLGARVLDACALIGRDVDVHTIVQTYHLARSLVESGAGVAVIDPFSAATVDINRVMRRPIAPEIQVDLFLLTPNSAPLSLAARSLVDCLKVAARNCHAISHS